MLFLFVTFMLIAVFQVKAEEAEGADDDEENSQFLKLGKVIFKRQSKLTSSSYMIFWRIGN